MTSYEIPDGPKMLRETLCVAQTRIGNSGLDGDRTWEHIERLGRLINACDAHRPLGPDGKHGDRHTPTCGCEDVIPRGILPNSHNCWELITPANGLPVDDHGDGIRHFDSRGEADSWAEGLEGRYGDLVPREMLQSCWTVTAICGWKLDDELPMVMHFDTADEARRTALDCDMRMAPSGGLICNHDCDDCRQGGSR